MKGRWRLLTALFLLSSLLLAACTPTETVRISPSPSPTAPSTSAAPATSAAASRTPSPTPSPSPSPTPTVTTSPGSTPAAACATQQGGSNANRVLLTAMRVAHNPGFDRVVFEFSPTDAPIGGGYGVPPFRIEVADTFSGPSGLPVTVAGNAHFRVVFENTAAHTDAGQSTLASSDLVPSTPLVKEVKIVEDFEGTVQAGIGLDHLVCPSVLTLSGPVRAVFDFPTPP